MRLAERMAALHCAASLPCRSNPARPHRPMRLPLVRIHTDAAVQFHAHTCCVALKETPGSCAPARRAGCGSAAGTRQSAPPRSTLRWRPKPPALQVVQNAKFGTEGSTRHLVGAMLTQQQFSAGVRMCMRRAGSLPTSSQQAF